MRQGVETNIGFNPSNLTVSRQKPLEHYISTSHEIYDQTTARCYNYTNTYRPHVRMRDGTNVRQT